MSSFYKRIVVANMRVMLTFLCIISVVSTSKIACDLSEKTYFVDDAIWRNAIIIILGTAFIIMARKYIPNRRLIYLIIVLIASLAWIFMTRFTPRSDQMSIYAGVAGLRNGNYTLFSNGGYFVRCPNQLGLVLICYLCSFIFGYESVLPLQILNAIAVTFLYKKLGDICIHVGLAKKYQTFIAVLGILFYPLLMYTTFYYGNLLGLACAVAAFDYEIKFFDSFELKYEIKAIVFIIFAVFAKTNYVIFLIGMIAHACVETIRIRKRTANIFLIVLLAAVFISIKTPFIITQKLTGIDEGRAISSFAYVAMGLQEGPRANGWYNSYNWDTYDSVDDEGNPNQADASKTEIKSRIKAFIHNPDYAGEFFLKKLASQWNNPTFEGYWINQVCEADIQQSDLIKDINSKQGSNKAYIYLDALMMLIYFGALAAFWLKDDFDTKELMLATVFVGGFLFHIFWEAKGQYTISYFVLLFPYAIMGLKQIAERFAMGKDRVYSGCKFHLNYRKIAMFAFVIALILFVFGNKIGTLSTDTENWYQYLHS